MGRSCTVMAVMPAAVPVMPAIKPVIRTALKVIRAAVPDYRVVRPERYQTGRERTGRYWCGDAGELRGRPGPCVLPPR